MLLILASNPDWIKIQNNHMNEMELTIKNRT